MSAPSSPPQVLSVLLVEPADARLPLSDLVRKHPGVREVRMMAPGDVSDDLDTVPFNLAILDPFGTEGGLGVRILEQIRMRRPDAGIILYAAPWALRELPGVPEELREDVAQLPAVERGESWEQVEWRLIPLLDELAERFSSGGESQGSAPAVPGGEDLPDAAQEGDTRRRVYEVAEELGVASGELLERLRELGAEVTGPSATFPEEHWEPLRRERGVERMFEAATDPDAPVPPGEDLHPHISVSESAERALGAAGSFARDSFRLDSVLLLAGLAVTAEPGGRDTSAFLARYLTDHARGESTGDLLDLLHLRGRYGIESIPDAPERWHSVAYFSSPDFWAAVRTAHEYARRVRGERGAREEAVISARHLIAALLAHEPPLAARLLLEELGYHVPDLRENLLERLRELNVREDMAAWERILLPRGAAPPRFAEEPPAAEYDADSPQTVRDQLEVTREVNALSAVLASSSLKPPLAVGLFGDWGTGKSFFMHKMHAQIASLARRGEAQERAKQEPDYCPSVVQIWFNAWHYMDANLWASLVSEIFERLAEQIREREEDDPRVARERLMARLAEDHTLLHEAERQKVAAEQATERATHRLQELRSRTGQLRAALRESPRALQVALAEPGTARELGTLAREVGLPETLLLDLRASGEELSGRTAKLRATWKVLAGRSFGGKVVLLLALVLVPLVGWGVARLAAGDLAWLAGVGSAVSIAVVELLAWVRPVWKKVGEVLPRVREIYQKAGELADRHEVRVAEMQRSAEQEISRLEEQESAARKAHSEAAERVQRLEEEIEEIRAGRRLHRFLVERSETEDYRRHQGIIATIRRDFDRLGKLLGESRADDGGAPLRRVDRIILYIDDLDRCPEERVVEVLQAVHLLLAFPLFVVVVGVDSRWLLRSLQTHYARILSDGEADGPDDRERDEEDDPWESTPHNYLEKIFQIPFTLRPMDEDGFGRLVASLVDPPEKDGGGREEAPAASGVPAGEAEEPARPEEEREAPAAARERSPREESAPAEAPPPREESRPEAPADAEMAAALRIGGDELKFIQRLGPLVHTPRAAKRFVNIYRFIRAGLTDGEMRRFLGVGDEPGEHRVAALLLAVLTGFPAQAAELFRDLQEGSPEGAAWERITALVREHAEGAESRAERADWEELGRALDHLRPRLGALPRDLAPYQRWARYVGRFSFHAGHVLTRRRVGRRAPAGGGASAAATPPAEAPGAAPTPSPAPAQGAPAPAGSPPR